jgi:hypothetical protein
VIEGSCIKAAELPSIAIIKKIVIVQYPEIKVTIENGLCRK